MSLLPTTRLDRGQSAGRGAVSVHWIPQVHPRLVSKKVDDVAGYRLDPTDSQDLLLVALRL